MIACCSDTTRSSRLFFRQRECQIWYVLQLFFVSRSGFSVNETKQHCEQPFCSHVRNHLCYIRSARLTHAQRCRVRTMRRTVAMSELSDQFTPHMFIITRKTSSPSYTVTRLIHRRERPTISAHNRVSHLTVTVTVTVTLGHKPIPDEAKVGTIGVGRASDSCEAHVHMCISRYPHWEATSRAGWHHAG